MLPHELDSYPSCIKLVLQRAAVVRTSRSRLAMPGNRRLASKRSLLSGGVAARSCLTLATPSGAPNF